MHPGKALRLQKIWKHKRAVIIPYDHGSFSGPVPGIEDPVQLTERIANTAADGILVTPGVLKAIAPVVGDLGVIVRIDGSFTKFARSATDYQSFYPVPEALKLGADAVIVFAFVDTPAEAESLRRLGATAAEADAWGIPLVAEILAPSLLNNHFGTKVFGPARKDADVGAETLAVARIGAEAGADVIKTRYTGDVEGFREVVQSCGAKVIVAGGPAQKRDAATRSRGIEGTLALAADCMRAGAAGVIFGRNVWQHPKMEKLIAAICAIVHEDDSVQSALKLLR
jgi:fructose-bisphosphate aldolase / 2-amino-3,7-dideoxy-D-threo-hept-6-ulosonate synthase